MKYCHDTQTSVQALFINCVYSQLRRKWLDYAYLHNLLEIDFNFNVYLNFSDFILYVALSFAFFFLVELCLHNVLQGTKKRVSVLPINVLLSKLDSDEQHLNHLSTLVKLLASCAWTSWPKKLCALDKPFNRSLWNEIKNIWLDFLLLRLVMVFDSQ